MVVKDTLNLENIRKWIDALRSGEYVQGTAALRTEIGYCCLGVAAVVHQGGIPVSDDTFPTEGCRLWFGVPDWQVQIPAPLREKIISRNVGTRDVESLVYLNDVCGLNFDELAECIEYTFLSGE